MQNSMWGGEPFNPLLLTWLLNCLRRHDGSSSGRRRQVVIIMHLIGPLSSNIDLFIHPTLHHKLEMHYVLVTIPNYILMLK